MPLFNPQTSITVSSPTASTVVTTVLTVGIAVTTVAADAIRKGLAIGNKSGVSIYVGCDSTTPTSNSNLVEIPSGGYYEFPAPIYTGAIKLVAYSGSSNTVTVSAFS
jgi:hypothetical protein